MSTTRTPIDATRALAILNSRTTVFSTDVDQQFSTAIQGNPTLMAADKQAAADVAAGKPAAKQYFNKLICNVLLNSSEAMSRPEIQEIWQAGLIAEAAGDTAKADEQFNAYLNAVQMTFNAIVQPGTHQFVNGDLVLANIGKATTKDGHEAVVITKAVWKAPVVREKVKFTATELLGKLQAPTAAVKNEAAIA